MDCPVLLEGLLDSSLCADSIGRMQTVLLFHRNKNTFVDRIQDWVFLEAKITV